MNHQPPTREGLLCEIHRKVHDKPNNACVGYGVLSSKAGASGFYVYLFADDGKEQKYPTIRDFLEAHEHKYRFEFKGEQNETPSGNLVSGLD